MTANDEANERATGGASLDEGCICTGAAKGADQVRKQRCAAIWYAAKYHLEVEDVVEMEEVMESGVSA